MDHRIQGSPCAACPLAATEKKVIAAIAIEHPLQIAFGDRKVHLDEVVSRKCARGAIGRVRDVRIGGEMFGRKEFLVAGEVFVKLAEEGVVRAVAFCGRRSSGSCVPPNRSRARDPST